MCLIQQSVMREMMCLIQQSVMREMVSHPAVSDERNDVSHPAVSDERNDVSHPADKLLRLKSIFRNITDEVLDTRKDRILYCSRICVHPDYSHQGVAINIVKLCLDLGTKKGFTLVCAEASSSFSERICLHLGCKNLRTVNANTLGDGIYDLSRMNYKLFKIFTRRLGPDTLLSSKL
nr:uncharacterized protein LOC128692295 [Cherax quadricarinatus]